MTRHSSAIRIVAVGVLVAGFVATTAAQPPARPPALPLVYYAARYMDDPVLHKELKLTDAQVKKLAEVRSTTTTINQFPPGSKERQGAAAVAEKALGEALDAGQVRRLKQIVLQQLDAGPTPLSPTILARIPEVADALKLTAEQFTKVVRGTRLGEHLTDAQKAKWAELNGNVSQVRSGGHRSTAASAARACRCRRASSTSRRSRFRTS